MELLECCLWHWEHEVGTVPATAEHLHPYFQIELCIHGLIRMKSGREELALHAGDWVLLPPETPHRIDYSGENLEYYSFKFGVEHLTAAIASRPVRVRCDDLTRWCIDALRRQHGTEARSYLEINANRPILEAVLLVMLHHALKPFGAAEARPRLLTALGDMVFGEAARINVQAAAEKLNMTVSQLKYRFASALEEAHYPEPRPTLKQYLDREIMNQVDRYLYYSDLPLGEIARQTRFNNIYTFSRFVRRMTGISPSERRAARDGCETR